MTKALKKNQAQNIYKGKYLLEMIKEKRGVTKGERREIIIRDEKTGQVVVELMKEAMEVTGGTRSGIIKAIRDGRKYKNRYLLKYSEEEKKFG